MKLFHSAWAILRQNRRAYLVINLVYYGTVLSGMIVSAVVPGLQDALLKSLGQAFDTGILAVVAGAYSGGQLLKSILLTFVVNFFIGSLASITLPSLVVPFSGFLVGIYRAILWGLLLSPTNPRIALTMIPHSVTLLLEGQAYILALLAAYVQGKALLWPGTAGVAGRWEGFQAGIKQAARVYLLVISFLAVAAVYEAVEVIAMILWLRPG